MTGTWNSVCYQTVPTNKYPVATAFPVFMAKMQSAGTLDKIVACYTSTITACGAGPATVDVFAAKAQATGVATSALKGCTDISVNTCDTWWSTIAPPGRCF